MRKLLSLLVVASLCACDDGGGEDTPTPDAGATPDAGPDPDAGGPDPDAGGPDPDAGPEPDAGPDPIDGTPLDGIALRWSRPLVLCNQFTEYAPLDEERARKVRVTLPPQADGTLRRLDLGRPLQSIVVEHGPLAAERWHAPADTPTVTMFQVQDNPNGTLLNAVIEHDLGPAGTLQQGIGVFRDEGETADLDAGDGEITWAWWPAGADPEGQGAYLRPCDGPPDLEDVEEVLVARGGERTMVVRRFRRGSTGEFSAGSEPMFIHEHVVALSDVPEQTFAARDVFSFTYAAEHHNWNEDTHVDFTRDLVHHALYFGDRPQIDRFAGEVVREVFLDDMNPIDSTSRARAVLQHMETDQRRTLEFDDVGPWTRVDRNALLRRIEGSCDGAAVTTLAWWQGSARLLTCANDAAPGFTLVGLVPLELAAEPAATGTVFEGAAIRPVTIEGRAGYEATVGSHRVTVTRRPGDTWYFVRVFDRDGEVVTDALAEPVDGAPRHFPDDVLEAATGDGAVSMKLVRRWGAQGVGESAIYAPVAFALTFGGRTYLADAFDAFDYTNTHHNWNDRLTATVGDVQIHWKVAYDLDEGGLEHTVWATGGAALPETAVTPR
jgi:hypothetical protein